MMYVMKPSMAVGIVAVTATLIAATDWQSDFPVNKKNLGITGSNRYFNLTPGYQLSYKHGNNIETVTVLDETKAGLASDVVFEEIKAEVLDIEGQENGVRLRCGGGLSFSADRVVLAIGNLPGEYPIRGMLPVYRSPHYVHVPWAPGSLEGIPSAADVLLVGAGLTSIDLAIELQGKGHRGVIHALSRRGLLPQEHHLGPAYPDFLANAPLPTTVREFSRRVPIRQPRVDGQVVFTEMALTS